VDFNPSIAAICVCQVPCRRAYRGSRTSAAIRSRLRFVPRSPIQPSLPAYRRASRSAAILDVPVIGHQTVSQQSDWRTAHRCNHNPLEHGVIFGLVKKLAAPIGAVKSVVNYFTGSNACSSRHRATHTSISVTQSRKRFASPFLVPPDPAPSTPNRVGADRKTERF
jgi:hypothetical protein